MVRHRPGTAGQRAILHGSKHSRPRNDNADDDDDDECVGALVCCSAARTMAPGEDALSDADTKRLYFHCNLCCCYRCYSYNYDGAHSVHDEDFRTTTTTTTTAADRPRATPAALVSLSPLNNYRRRRRCCTEEIGIATATVSSSEHLRMIREDRAGVTDKLATASFTDSGVLHQLIRACIVEPAAVGK